MIPNIMCFHLTLFSAPAVLPESMHSCLQAAIPTVSEEFALDKSLEFLKSVES